MTTTEQQPIARVRPPRYGAVFGSALLAGVALGVTLMLVVPPLFAPAITPTGAAEDLASEFGVSIVWTDGAHADSPGPGSFDPETPELIYVSSDLEGDALRHVVLHEAGHAMQHRMGIPYDECDAEEFARLMGSTYYAYEECM